VHLGELARKGFETRLEVRQRGVDGRLHGGRLALEPPGIASGAIGVGALALHRHVGKDEAQARNLFGCAEGGRQHRRRPVGELDRDRCAVFTFDVVDAGGEPGEDRLHRAMHVGQDVVRMAGLGEAHATHLGGPLSAPAHLVVVAIAPPVGFHGCEQRVPRQALGL
jgi:hypothetical protein